jgi:hypothetical protein
MACGAKPLSPQAANIVTVRDRAEVQSCQSLGKVDADVSFSSGMGSVGAADDKQTRINNELREKTAALGGTHVLTQKDAIGLGTSQEGEAFKCSSAAPASTSAPAAPEGTSTPAAPAK